MAASRIAQIKSSRTITPEDVLFSVKQDVPLTDRLREFLTWKGLRKNTASSSSSGKGTEGVASMGSNMAISVKSSNNLEVEDGISSDIEEEDISDLFDKKNILGTGNSAIAMASTKKISTRLPWDYLSNLVSILTNGKYNHFDGQITDDPNSWSYHQNRLEAADRLTSTMTKEEYFDYTECKQASFTYKKNKKFRDWLNASQFSDLRPNDDAIEMLGFLAYEAVRKLTEKALEIKKRKNDKFKDRLPYIRLALFSTPKMQKPLERQDIYDAYFSMQQIDKQYLFCKKLPFF